MITKAKQKEYKEIFDQVVQDILSGKLEHDQSQWHCGSAHCVGGWFEVKTIAKGESYSDE